MTDTRKITTEISANVLQKFTQLCSKIDPTVDAALELYEPFVIIKEERLFVNHRVRVDSFCKLECGEGTYIGKYVHIASFCHLGIGGGLLILEDGSCCASGVKIVTGSNLPGVGHGCSAIDPDAIVKRSFVHVKKNATLFSGVVVLPGVTVGEGAVVAAGAVVTKDIPDGETWGGVPAKKIRGAVTFPWTGWPPEPVTPTSETYCGECGIDLKDFRETCPSCVIRRIKKGGSVPARKIKGKESEDVRQVAGTHSCSGPVYHRPGKPEEYDHDCKEEYLLTGTCTGCGKIVYPKDKHKCNHEIGEQSLDMWTASQAEMYCWDEKDTDEDKK